MARRTPPLYAKGLYEVEAPWILTTTAGSSPVTPIIYTCIAIRSFSDLYELGIDPWKEFYLPMGVSQTRFDTDKAERAAIITLASSDGREFVYIPDTFIVNYPGQDDIKYSHIVLSTSLGPLPDYLDLSVLKTQLEGKITEVIGVVTPEVKENRAPSVDIVTPTNHASLEIARVANITLSESDYAKVIRLTGEKAVLQAEVDALTQILIDEGIFVP